MGRTKEYDRRGVLSKAIAVFWKKGFEATSMSELIKATGLNSASLYKEFGNKEGLYETALEEYREQELEPFIRPLIDEPNMKGIDTFLKGAIKNATSPHFNGCFMMNTLAEKEVVSTGAVRRVEKFCTRLETILEGAIRGAQKSGDIPSEKDPVALAHYLLCLIQGMVLYGRVEDHKPHVGAVIKTVKQALVR
jgi:TetR/AcrR family transcriptional repressor of nem operon